ncbi:MAG: hypothetical protein KAS92_09100, partial [Candidatus Omnitrophica bacterium]|nr:hypothetical protein [Candidatus Omnitrophota bacterium]
MKIYYSINGGAGDSYPLPISTGTSRGDGSFPWEGIPAKLSSDVIIRVSDFYDVDTREFSPSVKIQSILNITRPEVADLILAAGQEYSVEWSTAGWESGDNVFLQYSVDNGDWLMMAGGDQPYPNADGADDNSFLWILPMDAIDDNIRVRVVDGGNDDGRPSDSTNFNIGTIPFEIRAGLNVISPVGDDDPDQAEKWLVGSTHKITWGLIGDMDTVKMQISVDGSAFADISATGQIVAPTNIPADEGNPAIDPEYGWVWTIPDSISKQVKIRIVNEDDTDVSDASPKNFNIIGQIDFNPTLPQGGDNIWYVGETKAIAWTRIGNIPTVKLQYSTNGEDYVDIADAESLTQAESPFTWTVDNIIDPDIKIRAINTVIDGTKPTTPAVSGNIEVKGQLTINSPVLNDLWQVDNTYNVLWTPTGTMVNVKLRYSTNGFAGGNLDGNDIFGPEGEPAESLDAGDNGVQQSFIWKIPPNVSKTVTVRVINNADPDDVYGDSGVMKIVAGFKLLTPNGGASQVFKVDRNTSITWETHGAVTNALLQYSTNGFANEDQVTDITTVSAGTEGDSFSWDPILDGAVGTNIKIRIKDPLSDYSAGSGSCNPTVGESCTISDVSDQAFEVRRELEFLGSNG